MDINLNNAVCLVQKQNLTETVVTNVCTGAVIEVPHGTVDFIFGGGMAFLLLFLFGLIVVAFKEFY